MAQKPGAILMSDECVAFGVHFYLLGYDLSMPHLLYSVK